jgi:hypothetical protein
MSERAGRIANLLVNRSIAQRRNRGAVVYEREVLGEHPEFGVSGQLYKSDLLKYDRLTGML